MNQIREYFVKKAEENIIESEKNSKKAAKIIKKRYKKAEKEIENEINRFFINFGEELTLADVNKPLNNKEIKEFRKIVRNYLDTALKNNWRSSYTNSLKIASRNPNISRIDALKVYIYHSIQGVYEDELIETLKILKEQYEQSYNYTAFNFFHFLGFGVAIKGFKKKDILNITNKKWFGSNYKSSIWNDRDSLIVALNQEIPRSFVLVETAVEMAKRIEDKTRPRFTDRENKQGKVLSSKYERMSRTYMNYIANEASFKSSVACLTGCNIDVNSYIYEATLDYRTSEICRELDRKKFKWNERQTGVNFPPMHPNCRSTYIMDFGELNGERIAKNLNNRPYYVPNSMSYKEWAEKYGHSEKK